MQNSGIASIAPASFSEMYREYYDYVLTLVHKFGIDWQNAEDVTSIIMTKAFEKGLVQQYDTDLISQHTGKQVPFKSLLYGFVSAYVRHHRDRQELAKRRDSCFVQDDDLGSIWLAERGFVHYDSFEDLFNQDLVAAIRLRCQSAPTHHKDAVGLATFFDFVMLQVEEKGAIDKPELLALFEISASTLSRMMRKLRDVVDAVVAES